MAECRWIDACAVCRVGNMIFVTVGGQLPFDRLVDGVSDLACRLDEPIRAQTLRERQWTGLRSCHSMTREAYLRCFSEARLIIGHAGIGTFLTARDRKKPLILVPRRAALREHRSDHQMDTAHALETCEGVSIAWTVPEIEDLIDTELRPVGPPSPHYARLLSTVRDLVSG